MKRLFTFGCSYTNYIWPTWADFVSLSYDEYYNYGKSGAGNQCIFELLIEANITHKFTEDDTVIIMWSTYHRHDLYKDNEWHTPGNVLNAEKLYNEEYLKKYFDVKGSVLHSLNYIHAAQQILSGTGCQWHMSSMQSMTMPIGERHGYFSDLARKFFDTTLFIEFPELKKYKFIFDHDNWLRISLGELMDQNKYTEDEYCVAMRGDQGNLRDSHPTPAMHLDWCYYVGLAIDKKKTDELLQHWNMIWKDRPVHVKNGLMWVRENIPHNRF